MTRFKRQIAVALVAVLVALGAYLGLGAARGTLAPPMAACTYSGYENAHTVSKQFWSPHYARYETLYNELITWDGDAFSGYRCAQYRQYQLYQWVVPSATYGSYYSVLRAWVCGPYVGSWYSYSTVVYSAELYYPAGCGRQADNYGAYFYDAYDGTYISVYETQG